MAAGVLRKCRSAAAAVESRSAGSVVRCQHSVVGVPGAGTTASSPRRSCGAARCSIATDTPAPLAAADHAAVWFGYTLISLSGTPSRRSSCAVSLSGSAPDGPTSHGHFAGLPR